MLNDIIKAKVYRYSINTGYCGGIVFAKNCDDALTKVMNNYSERSGGFLTRENIIIWDWSKDEYYDKDHYAVIECYGC